MGAVEAVSAEVVKNRICLNCIACEALSVCGPNMRKGADIAQTGIAKGTIGNSDSVIESFYSDTEPWSHLQQTVATN